MSNYFISKDVFFNSIMTGLENNIKLLNQVKNDYPRIDIRINNIRFQFYYQFLDYIVKNYKPYLNKILLLCNQNAYFASYNKIFKILDQYEFHLTSKTLDCKNNKNLKVIIKLTPFFKHAYLYNVYDVWEINHNGERKIKTICIDTIIDLVTVEPVLIKLYYK
jgi:hypothetical protein